MGPWRKPGSALAVDMLYVSPFGDMAGRHSVSTAIHQTTRTSQPAGDRNSSPCVHIRTVQQPGWTSKKIRERVQKKDRTREASGCPSAVASNAWDLHRLEGSKRPVISLCYLRPLAT